MALKNFARRAFWSLPSPFPRHSNGVDARIISNRISVAWFSSHADKLWLKNLPGLDNGTSTIGHTRRHFQTCASRCKKDDLSRAQMVASMPKVDEGTLGENVLDVSYDEQRDLFPDEGTPNQLFDGIRFADLPICNITATPNNTIMTLTNAAGIVQTIHSCGREGFKNTREGTNIAAQATAITLATRGLGLGMKSVRVTVSGLGPGRMASIKGLTMAGMNVVSITDRTPVPWSAQPRPKKRRRL